MSLKRARAAAAILRNTVFGLVRQHEKKESINIPEMIKYVILSYYLFEERFEEHDKCIVVKGKGLMVIRHCSDGVHGPSQCSNHFSFAYGLTDVWDDDRIAEYEWTIRVGATTKYFAVGLTVKDTALHCVEGFPLGMYGLRFAMGRHYESIIRGSGGFGKEVQNPVDVVQIRLNLENKELSFYSDGEVLCKIGKSERFKIDKFRLVVMLMYDGNTATLINFKIKHR